MGHQKTVALVNHTAALGGGEYALLRLIDSIDRSQWCPVAIFGEEGPCVELFKSRSIETYVLPLDPRVREVRRSELELGVFTAPQKLIQAGGYVIELTRFLRERSPDLVHTNSLKAHILGGLAGTIAKIPVVWHLRDSIERAHLPSIAVDQIRSLGRWIPQAIVCVSQSVAAQIEPSQVKTPKARVVYDGLDDRAFENSRKSETHGHFPHWKVGMAGRLTQWKGQHLFIEAAALLKSKGYPIEWEIVGGALFGEQQYAEGLSRQVHELGLTPNVRFFGQIADIGQRLRSWHVSVHASTAPDPCPNVVLESMAAGVAVVGADGGGVPELLENGRCGELFRMGDSLQLASAIERLLLQTQHRRELVTKARERALQIFRSDRVAREVSEIWSLVLNKSPGRPHSRPWIEDPGSFQLPTAWRRLVG